MTTLEMWVAIATTVQALMAVWQVYLAHHPSQSELTADRPGSLWARTSPHLLLAEVLPLLSVGVLLNYFGLLFSASFKAVFFFDMIGTAVVAMLLGPWWAAITGVLSSTTLNYLTYAGPQSALVEVFPWALVNLLGGLYWGIVSRHGRFHSYLRKPSIRGHCEFMVVFGFIGAWVMAVPGPAILHATGVPDAVSQNPNYGAAITSLIGKLGGESWHSRFLSSWVAQSIYAFPDKVLTSMGALFVVRYAFPVYERWLLHGSRAAPRPSGGVAAPLVFVLVYAIPMYVLLSTAGFNNSSGIWRIWVVAPVVLAAGTMLIESRRHGGRGVGAGGKGVRRRVYQYVMRLLREGPHTTFLVSTMLAAGAAGATMVLFFAALGVHLPAVVLNCAVSTFGVALVLVVFQVSLAQNSLLPGVATMTLRMQREAIQRVVRPLEEAPANVLGEVRLAFPLLKRGRTCHLFEHDGNALLVMSDRMEADEVELSTAVPGKGCITARISAYWFLMLSELGPTHFIAAGWDHRSEQAQEVPEEIAERSLIVKRLRMLPYEFVVRGYLTGTAWNIYQQGGAIGEARLRPGMVQGERLDQPVLTVIPRSGRPVRYASKDELVATLGSDHFEEIRYRSLHAYRRAFDLLKGRGFLLADTKFEYGVADEEGAEKTPILADELITPNSSRIWKSSEWKPGALQRPWDREFIEQYLQDRHWVNVDPPPELPPSVVDETQRRYREFLKILVGSTR